MTKPILVVLEIWVGKVRRIINRFSGKSAGGCTSLPAGRQAKLYKADCIYVIWEYAILPKLSFVNVSKWSSDTIKGAAIKFYQHTHLPLACFPI